MGDGTSALLVADLRSPWSPLIIAVDASPWGYGAVEAALPPAVFPQRVFRETALLGLEAFDIGGNAGGAAAHECWREVPPAVQRNPSFWRWQKGERRRGLCSRPVGTSQPLHSPHRRASMCGGSHRKATRQTNHLAVSSPGAERSTARAHRGPTSLRRRAMALIAPLLAPVACSCSQAGAAAGHTRPPWPRRADLAQHARLLGARAGLGAAVNAEGLLAEPPGVSGADGHDGLAGPLGLRVGGGLHERQRAHDGSEDGVGATMGSSAPRATSSPRVPSCDTRLAGVEVSPTSRQALDSRGRRSLGSSCVECAAASWSGSAPTSLSACS